MRIVIYGTTDGSVPANQRFVARIRVHMPAAGKRKAGEDWCPIVIYGATEDDARANAQAWWDEQIAKEQAKAAAAQQRAERMRDRRRAAA